MTYRPLLFSSLRHCVGRCLVCTLALVALMVFSTPLHAATFTVNDLGDAPDAIPSDGICATSGNVCTLRAAIQTANSLGGANVITVPAGTIVLGSVLGLISNITITRAGTGSTVISGNGVTQVFVFSLNGINVAMNDLTIANGNATAGGGIFVSLSTLSLSRVLVTNNAATTGGIQQGGGIRLSGTLNMIDSTVSNNSAGFGGGGLRILTGAVANIVNSTFSGNTMTGANGSGAAIENQGTLNLLNSTISGNNSLLGPSGGLSLAGGAATIRFSTITGNASNYAPAQVQFFGAVGDTLAISGSIIGNPASGVSCSGSFVGTSLGNNLDSGNTCGFVAAGDSSNTNPLLSPLANNGGPTQTHALQAGSPAINAGPTTGSIPSTDQRGAGFARVLNGRADIGSFEATLSPPVLPVVSVGNASIAEGNAGTSVLNFPVSLSTAAPAGGVIITYSTASGTATAGSDYVAVVTGTVTIAQGATTGNLPVSIIGDTAVEPDETFTVTISNATNATLGTATATGTILNDDVVAPVLPVVSVGNASISEGNAGTKLLNFPVALSSPAPAGGVTITYSTANGSATAGSDYVAVVAGIVIIASGANTGNLSVTINGDTAVEPDETFTVTITSASNATLGTTTATGTILNDDVVVAIPVTPVPVNSPWMLLAAMLGVLVFAGRGFQGTAALRKLR